MIVIFDAINQLALKYQTLWWLPTFLPNKIYVICTSIEFIVDYSLKGICDGGR